MNKLTIEQRLAALEKDNAELRFETLRLQSNFFVANTKFENILEQLFSQGLLDPKAIQLVLIELKQKYEKGFDPSLAADDLAQDILASLKCAIGDWEDMIEGLIERYPQFFHHLQAPSP